MNKIEAKYFKTKYWSVAHPCVFIDGVRLDELVDGLYPDQSLLHLVPTLFSGLNHDVEEKIVWDRVLPKKGKSILPILMCPDDADLYCTLVVVEVFVSKNTVTWSRFGLDESFSTEYVPNWIGSEVKWFENNKSYVFILDDYNQMLKIFYEEREKNKN